jgi:hypothetical protein
MPTVTSRWGAICTHACKNFGRGGGGCWCGAAGGQGMCMRRFIPAGAAVMDSLGHMLRLDMFPLHFLNSRTHPLVHWFAPWPLSVQNALDNVSNRVGATAGSQDARTSQLDPFRQVRRWGFPAPRSWPFACTLAPSLAFLWLSCAACFCFQPPSHAAHDLLEHQAAAAG